MFFAPEAGIEPTTNSLTASCSTAELHRSKGHLVVQVGIEPTWDTL